LDGDQLGGKTVEEVGVRVQRLNPVAGKKRNLEKKATQHIDGGVNHSLSLTILWGCENTTFAREHRVNTEGSMMLSPSSSSWDGNEEAYHRKVKTRLNRPLALCRGSGAILGPMLQQIR
jgi:hypothetical protein